MTSGLLRVAVVVVSGMVAADTDHGLCERSQYSDTDVGFDIAVLSDLLSSYHLQLESLRRQRQQLRVPTLRPTATEVATSTPTAVVVSTPTSTTTPSATLVPTDTPEAIIYSNGSRHRFFYCAGPSDGDFNIFCYGYSIANRDSHGNDRYA